METDEFLEAQRNREVIESLQQRLEDLERINMDLEYRLGASYIYRIFVISILLYLPLT
jgi:hypothetical protein